LVGASPLRWRLGLVSRARTAAATVALVAASAAGIMWLNRGTTVVAPPDAVLGVYVAHDTAGFSILGVELRESDWSDSLPLEPSRTMPRLDVPGFDLTSVGGTASPSHRGAIVSLAVNDTGVIDLFRVEPGEKPRRITFARGDDGAPALSPDGRFLAFVTGRWSELSHYDVALLDIETDSVRRITTGDDTETGPTWSPDGTRLAFNRISWGNGRQQVCIALLSDGGVTCRPVDVALSVAGWLDPWRLLVLVDSAGVRSLKSYSVKGGDVLPYIADWQPDVVNVSPDARWVACWCSLRSGEAARPIVFPSDRPSRWRPLAIGNNSDQHGHMWLQFSRAAVSTSVRISRDWMRPIIGQPHKFLAGVFDSLQRPVSAEEVKWSALPATAGRIDSSSGILIAALAGELTVEARSGKNLIDRATVTVRNPGLSTVWREDWVDSAMARWYRLGWPDSRVVTLPDGRQAFHNNGDGSYISGLLSRVSFPTNDGIALEATVSTPAPLLQWQTLRFAFVAGGDTAKYEHARSRNATPYVPRDSVLCEVAWPTENVVTGTSTRQLAMSNSAYLLRAALGAPLLSGRWMTVRLQLFPDGRCGVALDGKPFAVLPTPTAHASSVQLLVAGNSYKTRVLVGPLRVMQGTPNDIDWT
ncbi:MAG: hypothetical protein ABI877_21520, partial [Gemmatimonadaceae bacterium]